MPLLLILASQTAIYAADDLAEELSAIRTELQQHQQQLDALEELRRDRTVALLDRQMMTGLVAETIALTPSNLKTLYKPMANGFAIVDEPGKFHLNLGAVVQLRYTADHADQDDSVRSDQEGFSLRRERMIFSGYAGDPSLSFMLQLEARRADNNMIPVVFWVSKDLGEGWSVLAGQMRVPMLREDVVSAFRMLAVERSYVNSLFTLDRSQLIQAGHQGQSLRFVVSLHDGTAQSDTDFNRDTTELGIVGRGEWLVAGQWKQFEDMVAFSDEQPGLMLGLGADYEYNMHSLATNLSGDLWKITADASIDYRGASATFAASAQQFMGFEVPGADSTFWQWGVMAQGSVFLIPDKWNLYARYEHVDFGELAFIPQFVIATIPNDSRADLVTLGTCWFFNRHDCKINFDTVWTPDALPQSNSGAGLLKSAKGDQVSVRGQFQIRF